MADRSQIMAEINRISGLLSEARRTQQISPEIEAAIHNGERILSSLPAGPDYTYLMNKLNDFTGELNKLHKELRIEQDKSREPVGGEE